MVEDSNPIITSATKIQAPVHFITKRGMPTLYANHLMIQQDESDFILSFYETVPPVIPAEENAKLKAIENIETNGLDAECVAKIRIAQHRFPLFMILLRETEERLAKEMKLLGEQYGFNIPDDTKN